LKVYSGTDKALVRIQRVLATKGGGGGGGHNRKRLRNSKRSEKRGLGGWLERANRPKFSEVL